MIGVGRPQIIGKIYRDGCPYCDRMKPEWEIMKSDIDVNPIPGAQVLGFQEHEVDKLTGFNDDLNNNGLAVERVSIQRGVPTIFSVCNGKVKYYEGEPTAKEMRAWFEQCIQEGLPKKQSKPSKKSNKSVKTAKKKGGDGLTPAIPVAAPAPALASLVGGSKKRQTKKRQTKKTSWFSKIFG